MQHEIKLRAYDTFHEVMVYSSEEDAIFKLAYGKWSIKFVREKNTTLHGIEADVPVWLESDELEMMECIGLRDKNKKDIYEGDILEVNWEDSRYPVHITVVKWVEESVCWTLGVGGDPKNDASNYMKVIGNIYEHSNLLANV